MNKTKVGLVVEGGGMRGAYTAGVLEAFFDYQVTFPYMIGVSAGANTLCSFLSGQKGRNERLYTEWITDKRFINIRNIFREGAYFGMDFLFNELPNKLDPFDFETFKEANTIFKVGVTHCTTGETRFFEPLKAATLDEADLILRASSSLPVIAKPVLIDGEYYLDGGISDAIPIKQSTTDGNTHHVIILTRNADYRKTYSKSLHRMSRLYLKKYPHIVKCIASRYKYYNDTLDHIAKLEAQGLAFVLRPQAPLSVGRYEKDPDKLKLLYQQGYKETTNQLAALRTWLNKL